MPAACGTGGGRGPLQCFWLAQHLRSPGSYVRLVWPGTFAFCVPGDTPVLCATASGRERPGCGGTHVRVGFDYVSNTQVCCTLGANQVGGTVGKVPSACLSVHVPH